MYWRAARPCSRAQRAVLGAAVYFHLHPLTGNLAGFWASRFAPIGGLFSASMTMATQPTLIMWIITDGDVTMPMHNLPHPGLTVRHDCLDRSG